MNVPKTQPVVESARSSRTATSTCSSSTSWTERAFDGAIGSITSTLACHFMLLARNGTCMSVAVVNSNLNATAPSANLAADDSGWVGSCQTWPMVYAAVGLKKPTAQCETMLV